MRCKLKLNVKHLVSHIAASWLFYKLNSEKSKLIFITCLYGKVLLALIVYIIISESSLHLRYDILFIRGQFSTFRYDILKLYLSKLSFSDSVIFKSGTRNFFKPCTLHEALHFALRTFFTFALAFHFQC